MCNLCAPVILHVVRAWGDLRKTRPDDHYGHQCNAHRPSLTFVYYSNNGSSRSSTSKRLAITGPEADSSSARNKYASDEVFGEACPDGRAFAPSDLCLPPEPYFAGWSLPLRGRRECGRGKSGCGLLKVPWV